MGPLKTPTVPLNIILKSLLPESRPKKRRATPIPQDYLAAVDGIIFVVDAADRTRFAEASGGIQERAGIQALVEWPPRARDGDCVFD